MSDECVIEFRSGTYFQGLDHDTGGPRATAWILAAGGMAVPS